MSRSGVTARTPTLPSSQNDPCDAPTAAAIAERVLSVDGYPASTIDTSEIDTPAFCATSQSLSGGS